MSFHVAQNGKSTNSHGLLIARIVLQSLSDGDQLNQSRTTILAIELHMKGTHDLDIALFHTLEQEEILYKSHRDCQLSEWSGRSVWMNTYIASLLRSISTRKRAQPSHLSHEQHGFLSLNHFYYRPPTYILFISFY